MLLVSQSPGFPKMLRTSKPAPMGTARHVETHTAPFQPTFHGSLLSRPVFNQKPTTPSQFLGNLARKHLLTMTTTLSTLGASLLQRLGFITQPATQSWPEEPIHLPDLEPEQPTADNQPEYRISNEPITIRISVPEGQPQEESIPEPLQNLDTVEPVAASKQETTLSSKRSSLHLAEAAASEDVEGILPKTPDNQSEPNSLSSSVEWVERPALSRPNVPQDLEAGWAMVETDPQAAEINALPKPLPKKATSRTQRITHFMLKRDNGARL